MTTVKPHALNPGPGYADTCRHVVYDAAGNVYHLELVDARERIKSGHYFLAPPHEKQPDPSKALPRRAVSL